MTNNKFNHRDGPVARLLLLAIVLMMAGEPLAMSQATEPTGLAVSANQDWNEFYYWMYSLVPGSTTTSIGLTDQLDVGDQGSESAHAYSIGGATWHGLQNSSYPQLATVTDGGRANRGYSQFVMALDPANNGAILTRRLDYTVANQTANVYVDGALAGQWSTPGANAERRWVASALVVRKVAASTAWVGSVVTSNSESLQDCACLSLRPSARLILSNNTSPRKD